MTLAPKSRNANRVAWRFARRTIARHRVRSALIALMVAVPVIGVMGATTVAQSLVPTSDEHIMATLGASAQASITVMSPPDSSGYQMNLDGWSYSYDTDEQGSPVHHAEGDALVSPVTYLPSGTRILPLSTTTVQVDTRYGVGGFSAVQGTTWDPSLDGRYTLEAGHAPTAKDEMLVSPGALDRLGASVGDTVHVGAPTAHDYRIVGVQRDHDAAPATSQLFVPEGTLVADPDIAQTEFVVPDLPVGGALLHLINAKGGGVTSRELFAHPVNGLAYESGSSLSGFIPLIAILAGYAVFQVCLLAGAAFLVGTRSDVRAIATMASVGADRRVAFRSVTFGGLALGFAGGLAGTIVGIVGGGVTYAVLDNGTLTSFPGFTVPWVAILVVLLLGVGCGWLSSLVGARSAGRADIVRAMRGLGRPARPRRLAIGAGVALIVLGAVVVLVGGWFSWRAGQPTATDGERVAGPTALVVGAVLVQLGVILAVPLVLHAFARLFGRSSTAARLAARDAARNGARSIPVLAAVMTTVFLAAAIATFAASIQQQTLDTWVMDASRGTASVEATQIDEKGALHQADPGDVATIVRGTFTGVRTYEVSVVTQAYGAPSTWVQANAECADPTAPCGSYGFCAEACFGSSLFVGEPDELATYFGVHLDAEARASLAGGGAIVLQPHYVTDGHIALASGTQSYDDAMNGTPATMSASIELPAVEVAPRNAVSAVAAITPETARVHHLDTSVALVAFHLGHDATDVQRDAIQAGMQTVLPYGGWVRYNDLPADFAATVAWILLAVAAVIMAGSSAVAIGLSRADAKRDDEVLDAIGAPPGLRRRIALWQGLVIAGVGAVVGTAIGMLPNLALAVQYANGPDATPVLPVDPPWLQLGLLAFGVPLVIAVVSWATAGRARVRVRRAA